MEPQPVRLEFARGSATPDELQTTIDAILAELSDPNSEAAQAAKGENLEPSDLANASAEVTEDRAGVEPISTTIAVVVAGGFAIHVVNQLWDAVVWPQIKRRLGADAVGPKKD